MFSLRAEVAELADALASGASGRKVVEVQILSSAPDRKAPFLRGFFIAGPHLANRWLTDGRDRTELARKHACAGKLKSCWMRARISAQKLFDANERDVAAAKKPLDYRSPSLLEYGHAIGGRFTLGWRCASIPTVERQLFYVGRSKCNRRPERRSRPSSNYVVSCRWTSFAVAASVRVRERGRLASVATGSLRKWLWRVLRQGRNRTDRAGLCCRA